MRAVVYESLNKEIGRGIPNPSFLLNSLGLEEEEDYTREIYI